MKKSTENLNELLQRFVENASISSMAEEIRQGDELLDRYPAPVLSADAKARIRRRLKTMHTHHGHRVMLKWVAIAAAAVIGVLVIWPRQHLSTSPDNRPVVQARSTGMVKFKPILWEETLFNESEKLFSRINAELDNIAETIESVRIIEINDVRDCFIDEQGIEQRETPHNKTNFWQG